MRNEIDGVGSARIFSEAIVVQIQFPRVRVHDDIFQHCAEPLRRGVNFGLGFSRQADHLGVAAAFEIEDRRIRPAMFIVADQCTRSEEHTSELQSLMRISYAVFCLKKKKKKTHKTTPLPLL